MDSVAIIIPHLGSDEQQEFAYDQCTESLRETAPSVPLITVKNGIPCKHEGVVSLFAQGQCMAVNAGAAITSAEWLVVTNDDMIYAPGWLEKMLETARRYNLKFLCPNLVEPRPGAPPFLVQPFGGAGGDFNKAAWLEFASHHVDHALEQGFNLPFLIHHDTWNRLGGYDVNYDPWGSNGDSDLQAKVILAGLETFRDRNIIVYHFSQTSGTFHPSNHGYWEKNYAYFTQKWGFDRQPESSKVWYSSEIINYGSLKYKPEWMEKLRKESRSTYNFKGDKV